jgi:hypothetical protein
MVGVVAFAAQWYRHWSFRSTTYDLAVFEQAVWKLSRLRSPEVTLVGWNAFADHFSPVLLAFAPLYRLAATPLWFFAAQAAAAAASVLLLRPILTQVGLRASRQWPIVLAFCVSPLLWNALLFDFHPTTLAVPLLLLGLAAAWRDDVRVLLLAAAGLVFLRDDLGLLVAVLAVVGSTKRWWLAAAGLAWVVAGSMLGEAMGSDRHWGARYGYLGESAVDAVARPFRSVPRVVEQLLTGDDAWLLLTWLVGFALLPLLAPRRLWPAALVALPLMAATDVNFHSAAFHYGAPALPFLTVAAGAGLERLPERWAFPHGAWLTAALAVSALIALGPPTTRSLTWKTSPRADAQRALAAVPPDAAVVAPAFLGPHLAHRDTLLPFPYPFFDPGRNFPLTEQVTEVSAARQRAVDVVIVGPSPLRGEREAIDRFTRSHVAGFRVRRFGQVAVFTPAPERTFGH